MSFNKKREYPKTWAQLDNNITKEQCPILSGFYRNEGEMPIRGNKYQPVYKARQEHFSRECMHLSFQLLSSSISINDVGTNQIECVPVTDKCITANSCIIELRQPDETQLQIKLWEIKEENKSIFAEELFDMHKGDFTCENGFMTLDPRRDAFSLIAGTTYISDLPSFSRNEDDWLIMKHNSTYLLHYTFLGLKEKETSWLRWEPVSEEEMLNYSNVTISH